MRRAEPTEQSRVSRNPSPLCRTRVCRSAVPHSCAPRGIWSLSYVCLLSMPYVQRPAYCWQVENGHMGESERGRGSGNKMYLDLPRPSRLKAPQGLLALKGPEVRRAEPETESLEPTCGIRRLSTTSQGAGMCEARARALAPCPRFECRRFAARARTIVSKR